MEDTVNTSNEMAIEMATEIIPLTLGEIRKFKHQLWEFMWILKSSRLNREQKWLQNHIDFLCWCLSEIDPDAPLSSFMH